jgi:hypothetical protein
MFLIAQIGVETCMIPKYIQALFILAVYSAKLSHILSYFIALALDMFSN